MSEVVKKVDLIPIQPVEMEGAKSAYIQWLITQDDGAPHFAMRRFVIKPEGVIPKHSHWYEHEIYVLKGRGIVGVEDREYEVSKGSVLYVPPEVIHWYRNIGDEDWEFLCIIPLKK